MGTNVIGSFSDVICLDRSRTGPTGQFSSFFLCQPSYFPRYTFLLRITSTDPLFSDVHPWGFSPSTSLEQQNPNEKHTSEAHVG